MGILHIEVSGLARRAKLVGALLFVLSSGGVATSARAQAGGEDEARAHFKAGQYYYEHGRFLDAAHEFEAAYTAKPHPKLLYNIYLAYRDLNRIDKAAAALRAYLIAEPNDQDADKLVARLGAMEASLRDEEAQKKQQAASAAPAAGASESTTARGPASQQPEASAPAGATAHEADGNQKPPSLLVPIVLASAGGALIVGAVVSQAVASGAHHDLEKLCPGSDCSEATPRQDERARSLESRGKTYVTLSYVLAGAGLASVGAAVALYFIDRSHADRATPGVAFGCAADGCGAVVQGRF